MPTDDDYKAADVFLKAAEAHRQRATMLHQNEWQIAVVFWTAIAGATAGALINASAIFPTEPWFLVALAAFYMLVAGGYLFGFCRANYKSLTEERSRYRYFQNRALKLVGASGPDLVLEKGREPGTEEKSITEFDGSTTWRFKTASTYLAQTASLSVICLLEFRAGGFAGAPMAGLVVAFLWALYGAIVASFYFGWASVYGGRLRVVDGKPALDR
jgi:hypothetical protein